MQPACGIPGFQPVIDNVAPLLRYAAGIENNRTGRLGTCIASVNVTCAKSFVLELYIIGTGPVPRQVRGASGLMPWIEGPIYGFFVAKSCSCGVMWRVAPVSQIHRCED